MKYANEAVVFWYMVMCTYIVLTNPESHIPFIGAHVAVASLYKWSQKREDRLRKKQEIDNAKAKPEH